MGPLLLSMPLLLPTVARAAEPSPPPASPTYATYGSVSTLLILPTAASYTLEAQRGRFAVSGSGFGGYMPDGYWFGGWASLGIGAAAHGIFGAGRAHFELAGGLDLTLMLDSTGYDDDRLVPFPTLFLGARWQQKRRPEGLVRLGVEASARSFLGVKVSVGRSRGTGAG